MKSITFPTGITEPHPTEVGEECWCISLVMVEENDKGEVTSILSSSVKGLTLEEVRANAAKGLTTKKPSKGTFLTVPFKVVSALVDCGKQTFILWSYSLLNQLPPEYSITTED